MAILTSLLSFGASGQQRRILVCYHGSDPRSDDPKLHHDVPYTFFAGERAPHVSDLWKKHGWGRRGKQMPVCPRHRVANDGDWSDER